MYNKCNEMQNHLHQTPPMIMSQNHQDSPTFILCVEVLHQLQQMYMVDATFPFSRILDANSQQWQTFGLGNESVRINLLQSGTGTSSSQPVMAQFIPLQHYQQQQGDPQSSSTQTSGATESIIPVLHHANVTQSQVTYSNAPVPTPQLVQSVPPSAYCQVPSPQTMQTTPYTFLCAQPPLQSQI